MEEKNSCCFRCEYTHDLAVQKEFTRGVVCSKSLNRVLSLTQPLY